MLARTPSGYTFDRAGWEKFVAELHERLKEAKKAAPPQMTDEEFDYDAERREGWANQGGML